MSEASRLGDKDVDDVPHVGVDDANGARKRSKVSK